VCGSGGAYYLHLGSESCPLDLVGTYSLSLWVTNEEGQRLKIPREVVLTYVTQSGTPTYFDVPGTQHTQSTQHHSLGASLLLSPPFPVLLCLVMVWCGQTCPTVWRRRGVRSS
jgi:hypothetical protein